jgi:hypothetical protein
MTLLEGVQPRGRWMRLGTAEILKLDESFLTVPSTRFQAGHEVR